LRFLLANVVHTPFHGYLENACQKAAIVVKEDAGITDLFARLREHSALTISDPEAKARIERIIRGVSRIVDARDLIRNRQTFVHPNLNVLDDA
jgi:hypothetical protein